MQVRNILSHDVPEKKIVLGSINEIVSIVKDCPHEEVIYVCSYVLMIVICSVYPPVKYIRFSNRIVIMIRNYLK